MEAELHACGYPAGLGMPYWNWTTYETLETSPLFDGSATSLGGNGDWNPDVAEGALPGGATLPRGTGGGCVTTGPFAHLTVSLGPFAFVALVLAGTAPANWTAANPRCLTRDLNDWGVTAYPRPANVTAALAYDTVGDFQ
jgi:tyrosinase